MPHSMKADLDTLAGQRVFFGHQSVGENILDGLRTLLRDASRDLPIVEWGPAPPPDASAAASPSAGVVWHAKLGRNEQPVTKCEDFRRMMDEDLAGHVDIALLKFCYIDINERTDVAALCDTYRSTLENLAHRHPEVTFVPVTAPLRHAEGGLGVWAREMLGKPNRIKLANLARHRFNERVRALYTSAPMFDLAAAEATRPDGRRETFTHDGTTVDNLVGSYTDDGGHLNDSGRRTVAAAFVRALALAARRGQGIAPPVVSSHSLRSL